MKPFLPALCAALGLTACGQQTDVNPPTEPAAALTTPEALQPVENAGPSVSLPGTGPASFVGRWAADPRQCPDGQVPDQAITITPYAFQGYENRCDLMRIDELPGGYEVALRCQSEGRMTQERARFASTGPTLDILWLDRPGRPATKLLRCTTLADTTKAAGG
ncbi:MAG: hypothetical protein EON88_24205 [Brevundimonas sp.]|nr:MAG: hypothetical protein EON88_24205 [Brevundimonas sp.]